MVGTWALASPSPIHGTFPWAQRLLQKLTDKAREQWAGNRDDDCRNRCNGELIEDDLVGRAPITTKQFVEDFKAAFS